MLKINAQLTISSWTSNRNPPRGITITIRDCDACAEAVSVEVTHEQLALALTGLSCIPCEAEFNDSGAIGKVSENKTEVVPFENPKYLKEGTAPFALTASAALKPFEVDGWKGQRSDLVNGHRREKNGYRVTFFRHVPK